MSVKKNVLVLFALAAVIICRVSFAAPAEDKLLAPFNYDASKPLNPRWVELQGNPSFRLYKVFYDSVNGEKVPALFFEPTKAAAPYPCIIMQHGYSSNKESAKGMGMLDLTRAGYAVFAIDAQYHGERKAPGKDIFSTDIESDAKAMVQTVIDLRRAVDLLQRRQGVDPNRISYIGVSMGAILGAIFAGVEPRVKAPVLVVGGGDWKTLVGRSKIGPAIKLRGEIESGRIASVDALAGKLAYVEPLNFIWRVSPRPVLLINNKHDTIVPTEANKLLQQAAREPKEIVWLDGMPGDPSGHVPPIKEVVSKSLEWWGKNL
jgi:cephalosporin-C deacetylase-like acetyl esterase